MKTTVEEIKNNAFESSSIATLNIPENSMLHTIGDLAFKGSKLKEIFISKDINIASNFISRYRQTSFYVITTPVHILSTISVLYPSGKSESGI